MSLEPITAGLWSLLNVVGRNRFHMSRWIVFRKNTAFSKGPGVAARYKPGDLVGVLPVHACLTANLMKRYRLLTGEWINQMPTYPNLA